MNSVAGQSGSNALFCSEFWSQLLNNDFNRGYFTALVLILLVLAAVLILRVILMLIFRNRRCRQVKVKCDGGDIMISRDAITDATSGELARYPQLAVNRIHLYRAGHHYSLVVNCDFEPDGESGMPELADRLKPKLLALYKRLFGIVNLDRIVFTVESLRGSASTKNEACDSENVINSGL